MNLNPNHDGHGNAVSFETLMALEKVSETCYRSLTAAFEPGAGVDKRRPGKHNLTVHQAFGGHVYAQAVWAAAKTVREGFVVHSVSGFWTKFGRCDLPFVYEVIVLHDGKGFSVRAVNVTQEGREGICFSCQCSFKLCDQNAVDYQERMVLKQKYRSVLEGKKAEEHPDAPSMDMLWFCADKRNIMESHPFPGLKMKKVDMTGYNAARPPPDQRSLLFYTTIGTLPSVTVAPNLHACAHLYASDRNSLFMCVAHFDLEPVTKLFSSLSQTVVLHTNAELLDCNSAKTPEKWFVLEVSSSRLADGRADHKTKIWDTEGAHLASSLQDGLMRIMSGRGKELEGIRRGWKEGTGKL